jgi:hypothetical protein
LGTPVNEKATGIVSDKMKKKGLQRKWKVEIMSC